MPNENHRNSRANIRWHFFCEQELGRNWSKPVELGRNRMIRSHPDNSLRFKKRHMKTFDILSWRSAENLPVESLATMRMTLMLHNSTSDAVRFRGCANFWFRPYGHVFYCKSFRGFVHSLVVWEKTSFPSGPSMGMVYRQPFFTFDVRVYPRKKYFEKRFSSMQLEQVAHHWELDLKAGLLNVYEWKEGEMAFVRAYESNEKPILSPFSKEINVGHLLIPSWCCEDQLLWNKGAADLSGLNTFTNRPPSETLPVYW
jgi:hypothetical protein